MEITQEQAKIIHEWFSELLAADPSKIKGSDFTLAHIIHDAAQQRPTTSPPEGFAHHSESEDIENAFGELARLFELDALAALEICDLISASLSKARKIHPRQDD